MMVMMVAGSGGGGGGSSSRKALQHVINGGRWETFTAASNLSVVPKHEQEQLKV